MGVITALGELLSPQYLLMMIAGTMGGIMIGAMPGLTSVMGVTLLLPFTYGMDPAGRYFPCCWPSPSAQFTAAPSPPS